MPRILMQAASVLSPNRVFIYGLLSSLALLAVIANALKNHSNFYAVAVHLSRSNVNVMVLANFAFLLSLSFGHLIQRVFFGQLRGAEVERLYDRMWFFITESLLAFTIFRDEFDISFALMFGVLLFTKCFHWLLSDRIEWMDQRPYPGPSLVFHLKMNVLFTLLWLVDVFMFFMVIDGIMAHGVGGTVLFANEYAILMASLLNSFAKYIIAVVEVRRARIRGGENAPPWEDKSMWIFYVELLTDFLKLTTYLTFFMLVLTFYGIPLNMIRDVYITARSFIIRCRDLMRYRSATRNMDQRYPNVTEDEMNAMSDRTCIICREEMALPTQGTDVRIENANPRDGPNMTPKKLPCGHFFHFYCLRSWLERQQSCPTCRRSVLDDNSSQRPTAGPGVQGRNAPQGANVFRFGAAQRQQLVQRGQLPLGNFAGFFNRMAGAQPQVAPGQNAQEQLAPLAGGLPFPNGNIGWYYPIHPGPIHGIGLQPLHAQQQAREFRGFRGPDGVWHRWQVEDGVDTNGPAQPASTMNMRSTLDETRSQRDNSHVSNQSSNLSSGVESSNSEVSSNKNAEETRDAEVSQHVGSINVKQKQPEDNYNTNERAGLVLEQTTASTSEIPSKTSSGSNNSGPKSKIRIPSLIPVYDPALEQLTRRQHFPSYTRPAANRANDQSDPGTSNSSHSAASTSQRSNPSQDRARSLGGTRLPYNSETLPLALSDEQLMRMDRLTREAIDERLKVLENVQGTVTRCIDELLRVRSIFPRTTSQAAQPERAMSNPTAPSNSFLPEQNKRNDMSNVDNSSKEQLNEDI